MNLKFPALVAVLLLTSGCAMASEPAKHVSPAAPAVERAQAPAASSEGRTRAEVHAEAVEAAKHHRSTFSQYLDFLKYGY